MPIYEYSCERCGRLIEQLQKVSERGPRKCETCGGKLVRVMSRSSFQLKGGGWYQDLYSSTPSPKKETGGESSKAGESKKPESAAPTSKPEAASPSARSSSTTPTAKPAPEKAKAKPTPD